MNKKITLLALAVATTLTVTSSFAAKLWETDFEKASAAAKASNRYMLLDFSGSDWCGWCMKLEKEVFSQKDFKKYAKENLVCVLLDFPKGKSLKKKLIKQNKDLSDKYRIRGYPSIIILDPTGEKILKTGYRKGGAEDYVTYLNDVISQHRKDKNIPAPTEIEKNNSKKTKKLTLHKPSLPISLAHNENRESRIWKAKNGASINASIIEEKGTSVILKKEDGSIVKIPKWNLSIADQNHIKELIETESTQ